MASLSRNPWAPKSRCCRRAIVVDLVAECPTRTTTNASMWSLGWIGGTETPRAVRNGLVAWTEQMIRTIAPHTARESYQNFPNRRIADFARSISPERVVAVV